MARFALVVLVAAALAVAASAAAPPSTKGKTLRGYTFSSDVGTYLGFSVDIAAIKALLNSKTPDFKGAQAIYLDGSNAFASDGQSLVSLRSLVTAPNSGTPFWNQYTKYFESPYFTDEVIMRAMGGVEPYTDPVQRVQLIVKGLESSLQFAIVMENLDLAVAATKAKKTDAALNYLDRAWAVFVGGEVNNGLWTVSMKRANEFGTKVTCDSSIATTGILAAFLDAQKAAKSGDASAVEKARNTVQSLMASVFVQATITYAHEMWLDKQANIPTIEHQAEAFSFYRTIAPLVAAADPKAAQALDFWLYPSTREVDPEVDLKVARALTAAYKGLGITPQQVGKYGEKQPKLGCKDITPPTMGTGILTATSAGDALRPDATGR